MGEVVTEVDAPAADGLAADGNTPFQQQFFDVPIAECEAVIEPDGVANDHEGEPVPGELLTAQHRVTLPQ